LHLEVASFGQASLITIAKSLRIKTQHGFNWFFAAASKKNFPSF
jgi:hypothetical protein